MQAIDMTHIYGNKNYRGNWVALIDFEIKPRVVAYAKTLKETRRKAEKKGYKNPAFTQIPQEILPIVGII